jgi:hypothetical protein
MAPFPTLRETIMQRATLVGAALLTSGALIGAVPGHAQTELSADLGLYSSYIWRGLSLTNKPVAQPAVYVSFPLGNASLTLGGWSTIDLGKYDDLNDDISESGGSSAFNFAEFDPIVEVSFPVGKATLTAGGTAYIYPNDENAPGVGLLTSDNNTVELYGKAEFDVPLAPQFSIYYDVDKIKGAYLEGGVSHSLPASEKVSIDLGAVAGVSAGQGVSDDPDELANFADDGFTHLDLSAGVPFTAGVFSITPVVHVIFGSDDFTKFTSPTDESDVKLWGGVTLSWSKALGEVPEEAE